MVEGYIHSLINFLHLHLEWANFIAFSVSFLESLAIIGTIIPGSVTMTALGALIGASIIPGSTTLAWIIAGAYTGDCLSYWIGYYYNEKLRRMWPFSKYPKWLIKGEEFFKAHGGKSVVIGRFTGPVRSMVPMIAGILLMRPLRFLPIALLSAIMWAIVYVTPGIILGALSLELPASVATKFIVVCLLIIALLWCITWLLKYSINHLWQQIDKLILKTWNYLHRHKRSLWITKLLRNPRHKEDHRQLELAFFMLLSLLICFWIVYEINSNGFLVALNAPIYNLLQSIHFKFFDVLMIIFSILADKYVLFFFALSVAIALGLNRCWWALAHWIALSLLCLASGSELDILIHSPRPFFATVINPATTSPSSHVLFSTTIFGFLAVMIARQLPKDKKSIPFTIATIFVACIAFSRLYLGAHWLTDVLAAIFFGLFLILLTTLSYERRAVPSFSITRLSTISLFVFVMTGFIYGYFNFKPLEYQITHLWPTQTLNEEFWWKKSSAIVPLYRENRIGNPIEPLNIQWEGSLADIKQLLLQEGWEDNATHLNLHTTITRLTSAGNPHHLPLLPALFHNRSPVLMMSKTISSDNTQPILMLRLWQSDIVMSNNQTLWVGSIYYYHPPTKLIALPEHKKTYSDFGSAINALLPALKPFHWKIITVMPDQAPSAMSELDWGGRLLLIKPKR